MQRHVDKVTGVISGWDRLRLPDSLRLLHMPSVMKEYLAKAGGAGRTPPDLCRKPASNNHLTLLTKPLGFSHGLLCGAEKLTQMVYLWPIRWRPSCWVCRACSAS